MAEDTAPSQGARGREQPAGLGTAMTTGRERAASACLCLMLAVQAGGGRSGSGPQQDSPQEQKHRGIHPAGSGWWTVGAAGTCGTGLWGCAPALPRRALRGPLGCRRGI